MPGSFPAVKERPKSSCKTSGGADDFFDHRGLRDLVLGLKPWLAQLVGVASARETPQDHRRHNESTASAL